MGKVERIITRAQVDRFLRSLVVDSRQALRDEEKDPEGAVSLDFYKGALWEAEKALEFFRDEDIFASRSRE